jgi:SAM-dependent methyltransferase
MERPEVNLIQKQQLPAGAIRLLRSIRKQTFHVLEPLDYLARVINDKKDFPSLYLRRYVGPLRSFEMSGAEFFVYLKMICALQPHERVLDIGCGCGMMAMFLKDHLDEQGVYVGVDIHEPSIQWSRKNISRRHRNFIFRHIDVRNEAFNPSGKHPADRFRFPFDDRSFDLIILKSVFTHMRPQEVDHYLSEIARLLSERGRCLATFFLLNRQQETLEREGRNKLHFAFGDEDWRYVYQNSPESAVAFKESYVLDLMDHHNLKLRLLQN